MADVLDLQRNLQRFQRKAHSLLTDLERDYLHDILRQYHTYKDVQKLMVCLQSALDTPRKLDLLKEIRSLIPSTHIKQYDELAPYTEMAHPYAPEDKQKREQKTARSIASMSWNGSVHVGNHDSQSLCHITIQKVHGSLGFSIRGGSEHGLGIFVSSVDQHSAADINGLEIGDQLIEVNNVNFENIATSSAVMVLQGSNRLRMKVKRTGKVPGFKFAREKMSWYDTVERIITDQDSDGQPTPPRFNMSGTRMLQDAGERRVIIKLQVSQYIGFNLRGGSEYGLGIYVSKVDRGGQASISGIQVGDQIVDVNGESFLNISHSRAIDFLRNQRHLIMTIRTVNRYPAYKEMVAEYSWVNEQPVKKNKRPPSRFPPKVPPLIPPYANGSTLLTPMDLTERFTQTPPLDEDRAVKGTPSLDDVPFSSSVANRMPSQGRHRIKRGSSASDIKEVGMLAQAVPTNGAFDIGTMQRHPHTQPPAYIIATQNAAQTTSITQSSPPQPKNRQQTSPPDSVDGASIKRNQTVMGTNALKSDNRSLGRSQSMKYPGEKHLPPMPEKGMNDRQKVKRNRTFREILFGMKMKRKEKDKDKSQSGSLSGKVKRRIPLGSFRKSKSTSLDGLDKVSRAESDPSWANRNWAVRRSSNGDLQSLGTGSSHGSDGKQSISSLQDTAASDSPQPLTDFEPAMTIMMDLARKLLTRDECSAIDRHIRRYHEERDVERLVHPLLAILDKVEKVILLREIRGTLYQTDLGRFESMVARREADAFEELQCGTATVIRRSPMLKRSNFSAPPKKTILETKPNTVGEFHLQTTQNMEREKRRRDELDRLKKERQEEIRRKMKEQKEADEYAKRTMAYGHIPMARNADDQPIRNNDFKLVVPNGNEDIFDNQKHSHRVESSKLQNASKRVSSPTEQRQSKSTQDKHKRRDASDYFQRDDEEISPKQDRKYLTNQQHGNSSVASSKKTLQEGVKSSEIVKQIEKPKSGLSSNMEDLDDSMGSGKFTANPIFGMDNVQKGTSSEESTRPKSAVRFELNDSLSSQENSPRDGASGAKYNSAPSIVVQDELDFVIEDNESVESDGSLDHVPTGVDDDESYELRFSDESDASTNVVNRKGKYQFVVDDQEDALSSSSSSTMLNGKMLEKKSAETSSPSRSRKSVSPVTVKLLAAGSRPSALYTMVDVISHRKSKDHVDRPPRSPDGMEEYYGGRESALSFNSFKGSPVRPKKGILKNRSKNSVILNGSSSEEEPSPFKDIMHSARVEANNMSSEASEVDEGAVQRIIKKTRTSLGISISGGCDSRQQPRVLVDKVFPGGAAHDDGFIQPGFELIEVDGESLQTMTHNQAVDIIRRSYNDNSRDRMMVTVITT